MIQSGPHQRLAHAAVGPGEAKLDSAGSKRVLPVDEHVRAGEIHRRSRCPETGSHATLARCARVTSSSRSIARALGVEVQQRRRRCAPPGLLARASAASSSVIDANSVPSPACARVRRCSDERRVGAAAAATRTTPTSTPRRMPWPRTPANATAATANSERLNRQSLAIADGLTRPVTAASTIAASTGCGRSRSRPENATVMVSRISAAIKPDSGVRAPPDSLTNDWTSRR